MSVSHSVCVSLSHTVTHRLFYLHWPCRCCFLIWSFWLKIMLPLSGSFLFMSLVSVVTSPVQSVQLDHQIREVDGKHRYRLCTQASAGTCVVSRHVTCVQAPTPLPHPTLMWCVVALKRQHGGFRRCRTACAIRFIWKTHHVCNGDG